MIYYLILIILFAFSFYEIYSQNEKHSEWLFYAGIAMLVLLDGLRWSCGTDWMPYYQFFEFSNRPVRDFEYFEPLYVLFTRFIRLFTDQYTVFLFCHSLFCYGLIGNTIWKYARFPLLTLALFYSVMLCYQGMNRQYMAMAILIFSVRYIINRDWLRYLICFVIAFNFHHFSLLFLPAYFVIRPWPRYVYIGILTFFVVLALSGVTNRLPSQLFYVFGSAIGDRADTYMYKGPEELSRVSILLGIGKRVIWIIFILIYYRAFSKVKNFPLYFNLYFVSACIYMNVANSPLQQLGRGLLVFMIFESFILPYLLYVFKNNQSRIVALCIVYLYAGLVLYKNISTSVFDGQNVFIPYKCVLFEK
jgi:hypothetical protein